MPCSLVSLSSGRAELSFREGLWVFGEPYRQSRVEGGTWRDEDNNKPSNGYQSDDYGIRGQTHGTGQLSPRAVTTVDSTRSIIELSTEYSFQNGK